MIISSRFLIYSALFFSQVSLANTELATNLCESSPASHLVQGAEQQAEKESSASNWFVLFLGLDIVNKNGERYLRARFYSNQLTRANFRVQTEHNNLHCGLYLPANPQSQRQVWAVDLPASIAIDRLRNAQSLTSWVHAEQYIDGQRHVRVVHTSYSPEVVLSRLLYETGN